MCERKPLGAYQLRPSKIRADTSDHEYLDNWVEKLDLLCESKERLGLMGSTYFMGIILSMIIVPKMTDNYGRKWIFVLTMLLSLLA